MSRRNTHLIPSGSAITACGRIPRSRRPLPNGNLSVITCPNCRRTHAFLRLEAYSQMYPIAA